jgi:hypothetical protein
MTQTVDVATDDGTQDFTKTRQPVRFKIRKTADGDEYDSFDGVPGLPAMLLVEFASLAESLSEANVLNQPKIFSALFELVLTESSAARFLERMSSRAEPIELDQINDIMPWLMERYGLRPTEPSSDSSTGSESQDGGTNLTADAPPPALTSVSSAPSASST